MNLFRSFLIVLFFTFSLHAGDKTVFINDVSENEGDSGTKTFTFTVTATDNVNNNYTIDYMTIDGTATAESDYVSSNNTVHFDNKTNTATISVTVNSDTTPEANETFSVIIFNPQGGGAVEGGVSDGVGVGTIINDDIQPWPPIISDIPDQIAIKDVEYILDISNYVTEVNGDDVNYTLSGNLPANLIFYPNEGILSGTPTELGEFPLSVYATDKDGNSEELNFTITVDYGFCYEYAYKQQDVYFTEPNFDGHYPKLIGTEIVTNNEAYPVEMTLYLRHRSSLNISDANLSILDINTTQVEYILETTELTDKNSIISNNVTDDGDTTTSNIYNISLGDLANGDYFYINYDLNPKLSTLDTPINVDLSFSVSGNNYQLTFGDEIPLCSLSSGIGYTPVSAIFNAVHSSYYNSTTQYYNLPTQVVKRVDDYGVISLEPGTDILKPISMVPVEVELIDVDMYGGDAEAACQEPLSAVTPRVLFIFGPNDTNTSYMNFNQITLQNAINEGTVTAMRDGTTLSIPSDFYKKATKNTAFRLSYNFTGDGGDLIQLEDINGSSGTKYNVLNFPDAVKLGECVQDMDGKPNNSDMVAQYCSNAGTSYASAMTPAELRACLECVYGFRTRLSCSRDNFSIRPEAFKLKLDDQNQTDITSQYPLTSPANIAAGYNYNIEVTATSHIDENASFGYSKTFTETTPDKAQYIWNSSFTECNDDNNKTTTVVFNNGIVDGNTSIQQVGDYVLNITDTTWTAVDWNTSLMAHHNNSLFISGEDCIVDSTTTSGGTIPPIGCNISSSHTNSTTGEIYSDYIITSHPYKFDLNITSSAGLNHLNIPYVYIADISMDENMSFHLNGTIRAFGYDNSVLSNFVNNCYAKDLNLTINKSDTALIDVNGNNVAYQARFHNLDINGTVIIADDINFTETNSSTPVLIQTAQNYFTKNLNGTINTRLNLNYNREINASINPKLITFANYNVDCNNSLTDCTFSADLTSKTTQGMQNLDHNITHLYGRTHASRQRYRVPEDHPYQANIYFEAYCFGTDCNKTLLPNGLASKQVDDIRWFINADHNTTNDGAVGIVLEKIGTNVEGDIVDATDNPTGNPSVTTLNYDESKGYPYKTTMQNEASRWLIYNEDDPTATRNEFQVEFDKLGDWTGEHETNTTTKSTGGVKTNRRIMW